jgi:DnaJ family protein A protein 2
MAAEDLFAQFFGGGGGPFSNMFGGGGRPQGPPKAKTIAHIHKVSLEDIYKGKTSKLALQRSIICATCKGLGGKPGAVKTCTGCDGRGVKTITRQMGPMIQRFQTVCPDCSGEGEVIREKDRCKECHGKKTTIERKVIQIHIDRGVRSGTKIPLYGEGDQVPGAEPGDVIFEIEEKPHERFQRREDDLHYKAEIDLLTALAGGRLNIEHLDDRWITIEIMPGEVIAPNSIKVVREQGMPSHRHHHFGNLYIHFDVKFPTRIGGEEGLKPEDVAALEKILPPRVDPTPLPADAMTEDFVLEELDPTREGRSMGATEEDDDDMHPGGERVQCATQ